MMTSNNIFQEIESLHSELERMDKSAKLGWLAGEKMRLNRLTNQFAYASRLLEMINAVDTEGAKVANDVAKDAIKDMMKSLMR